MKLIKNMSLMEVRELTEECNDKLVILYQEQRRIISEIDKVNVTVYELKNKERQLSDISRPIVITDHVVMRYLERVLNINVDSIKKEIRDMIEPEIKINGLIDGTYKINDLIVEYKNKAVITVYKDDKVVTRKKIKEVKRKQAKISKRIIKQDE